MSELADVIVWFFALVYRFLKVSAETIRDHEFRALFVVVFIILVVGMAFYHNIEGWRYIDALYFSVTTLTTVGYGDIVPATDIGKLFTVGYILVGIGVLLSFVNVIAHHALKSRISVRLDSGFNSLRMPRPPKIMRGRKIKYRYRPR